MSNINSIGNNDNKIFFNKPVNSKNNKEQENNEIKDKVEIKSINDEKKKFLKNERINPSDKTKRPIKINKNNSTFFINYKGENKKIQVEPGNYTLTEISLSIKEKVNESFGINEMKLELTGTISDRLIYAKENETNKISIKK